MREIAAVKLTGSTGEELWRYQTASSTSSSLGGGGFGVSYVLAVAVDGDDNPVLVGSTYNRLLEGVGVPGDWDFFAIKLAGDTGDEIWRMQGGAPFVKEGLRGAKVRKSANEGRALYTYDFNADLSWPGSHFFFGCGNVICAMYACDTFHNMDEEVRCQRSVIFLMSCRSFSQQEKLRDNRPRWGCIQVLVLQLKFTVIQIPRWI